MAPPTQGTWRSDDYVGVFRLVDAWFSIKWVVKLLIYTFRWSTQTCATMLAITSPSHSHHISNITFPDYLLSDTGLEKPRRIFVKPFQADCPKN